MKPTLLVLAAGIGSRYGGLKQLDPIGPSGEVIIDYSIYDAIRAGFGKVVFVIRQEIEADFRQVISRRYEGRIEIAYAYQELDCLPPSFSVPAERVKPWGTGHAVLVAKELIHEPFAVINADDFYGRSGYQLLADYLSSAEDNSTADYCMVGFILRNTLSEHGYVSRGVCETDSADYLSDVVERTKIEKSDNQAIFTNENEQTINLTADEIVSMNMWGFPPCLFRHLETQFAGFMESRGQELKSEFFIPTVVNNLIQDGSAKVKILKSEDRWFGVTYPEDKPVVVENVRQLIAQGIYPEKLF